MDQSPLLVLISQAVWDRESSCPWNRQEKVFKCFNKYLFEFLKLVGCFPIWSKQKGPHEGFDVFSGLCNLEDFILHKAIFFIYLKLVLSYI